MFLIKSLRCKSNERSVCSVPVLGACTANKQATKPITVRPRPARRTCGDVCVRCRTRRRRAASSALRDRSSSMRSSSVVIALVCGRLGPERRKGAKRVVGDTRAGTDAELTCMARAGSERVL